MEYKTKACSTCKKTITNDKGAVVFKCPNCKEQIIIRCSHCRELGSKYICTACGFEGPN